MVIGVGELSGVSIKTRPSASIRPCIVSVWAVLKQLHVLKMLKHSTDIHTILDASLSLTSDWLGLRCVLPLLQPLHHCDLAAAEPWSPQQLPARSLSAYGA